MISSHVLSAYMERCKSKAMAHPSRRRPHSLEDGLWPSWEQTLPSTLPSWRASFKGNHGLVDASAQFLNRHHYVCYVNVILP